MSNPEFHVFLRNNTEADMVRSSLHSDDFAEWAKEPPETIANGMMRRILLAVCMMLALAIPGFAVTGNVVHADTGNGATVIHQSQCQDIAGGYTYCVSVRFETNSTPTQSPSGNYSSEQNGTATFTFSYQGQTLYYQNSVAHIHVLSLYGQVQEGGWHQTYCLAIDGQSFGATADYHYANGMTQYLNITPTQC